MFNQNRLAEKDHESSVAATLVSRLTCSAALPDTGKQDTDTDIVTADIWWIGAFLSPNRCQSTEEIVHSTSRKKTIIHVR